MDNFEVELKLTVAHVKAILKHLGANISTELETINLLQNQTNSQLQAATTPIESVPAPAAEAPVQETQAAEPPAAA